MRRPAFTLIELLIASVLFVSVAGFSTAIFSTTTRFQFINKQNQSMATQVQLVTDSIRGAIERSVNTDPTRAPHVYFSVQGDGGTQQVSQGLAIYSRRQLSDGSVSGSSGGDEWHYYCVENLSGAYRLARYVIPGQPTLVTTPTVVTCTKQGITTSGIFGAATIPDPSYLTETNVDISALYFIPVIYSAGQVTNPPALRIEIVAKYDPTNSGGESRVSDSFTEAGQLVIRKTATRADGSANSFTRNP